MGSNWIGNASTNDPPWTGGLSSGFRGQAGHVQVISGDLYMLAPTAQSAYTSDQQGWVWKSTDDGANWTRLNATSLTSYLGLSQHLSSTMIVDGTDLIFVVWHGSNSLMYAAKFSITTDTWTGNSSTSITTSGAYTSYVALDSATDGTTMYVNHPFATEKIMGTAYGRAAWRPLTISTLSWGSDTKWEDTGVSSDQTSGPIVVDAAGDVHTVICDKVASGETWEHFEDTGTIQGPHSISGIYSSYNVPPVLSIETIASTETLILISWTVANSYAMTVWTSTNNGVTWTEEATLDDYTGPNDPVDHRAATVLKDSSDMLYLTWATSKTGGGYIIWEWTRTSGGTWSTPSEILTQFAFNPVYPANAAWSDEPNGLYFYCVDASQVSGSESMLWGTALGGALTLQKIHTTDMKVSLPGAVAGIFMPSGANPGSITSVNYSAPTTWAVSEDDPKTLIGRQWVSTNPDGEGYNYSSYGAASFTFSADIAAFDVQHTLEFMVIQLVNGEIYAGSYDYNKASYPTSGVYQYNDWRIDQGRYTNGPHMKPRKIADAPAVLPDYWGVRIAQRGVRNWGDGLIVISNYEKVAGVNKVVWHWPCMDEDYPEVWGDGDAVNNPLTIGTHGIYHTLPQFVDPANTTYHERVVGVFDAEVSSYGADTGDSQFMWTREEASNTYVYAQNIPATAVQQIWTTATAGGFTLNFPSDTYNAESGTIDYNDSAATVQTTINAMSAIDSVTVTGSGTKTDPWEITISTVNGSGGAISPDPFNRFYEGTTNTLSGGGPYITEAVDPIKIVEVKHQTVPRFVYGSIGDLIASETNVHLFMTDTDGKLSVMRPVYESTNDRWDAWQFVGGRSISSGNVAHLNGVTQAIGWRSGTGLETAEDASTYDDYRATALYQLILYIDDTTKDIKALTSAVLGTYEGDGDPGYPVT